MELPQEKPNTLTAANGDDTVRLLAFVRDRDVACPLCGYNLRALTQARCPECEQELILSVGIKRIRLVWLLVSIVPGAFSGIAAGLLLIAMVVATLAQGSLPPWEVIALDLFGWASGIATLVLFKSRLAFMRLPNARQRTCALMIWGIHLGVFFMLVALAP